jgi:Putative peptidoglycan binding domain
MHYPFFRHRYRPWHRYGRRFYRRRRPYRWSWLRRYSPEGPISSSFVAWTQSVLAQLFGPVVPQDGVFGPETRGFVAQFQAQQGLPATGDLDDPTVAALQAVGVGPELSAPIPSRPEPRMPRGPHPEPGMPRRRHGDTDSLPPGERGQPRPPPGEHAMTPPERSAAQLSRTPISPAAPASPSEVPPKPNRRHGQPAGSSEESELAPSSTEVLERGRWVRRHDRIVLIGA